MESLDTSEDFKENCSPKESSGRFFQCQNVKYKSKRRSNYQSMHKKRNFKCCDMEFPDKASLWSHRQSAHGAQGYKCRDCQAVFTRLNFLQRHDVVHIGEKNFKCSMCNYAAASSSNLKRHCANMHGISLTNSSKNRRSFPSSVDTHEGPINLSSPFAKTDKDYASYRPKKLRLPPGWVG